MTFHRLCKISVTIYGEIKHFTIIELLNYVLVQKFFLHILILAALAGFVKINMLHWYARKPHGFPPTHGNAFSTTFSKWQLFDELYDNFIIERNIILFTWFGVILNALHAKALVSRQRKLLATLRKCLQSAEWGIIHMV